jgi:hypothetical protein
MTPKYEAISCDVLLGFVDGDDHHSDRARDQSGQASAVRPALSFDELVCLFRDNGFSLVKEQELVRYYGKPGWPRLIRVDYHGSKEVPTGTCHAILKAAGIPKP